MILVSRDPCLVSAQSATRDSASRGSRALPALAIAPPWAWPVRAVPVSPTATRGDARIRLYYGRVRRPAWRIESTRCFAILSFLKYVQFFVQRVRSACSGFGRCVGTVGVHRVLNTFRSACDTKNCKHHTRAENCTLWLRRSRLKCRVTSRPFKINCSRWRTESLRQ